MSDKTKALQRCSAMIFIEIISLQFNHD